VVFSFGVFVVGGWGVGGGGGGGGGCIYSLCGFPSF